MDISTLACKIQLCYSTTELVSLETGLTMSTLEISELTGSRHDSVRASLQTLVNSGVVVVPTRQDRQFTDKLGRPRSEEAYVLDERSSLILVARISPEFTAKLVDQWLGMRSLIRTQQLLIEKQAEEKAAAISEKLKIAEEAENLAERRVAAAKDLMAVFKPGQLVKKVKDDPYWKQLCIETLEAFLSDPKLSTHYANEHDNAVKECVNVQDKLNDVLRYVKTFMTVKPNGIASRFPDCTEVLSYRRNLLR